MDNLKAVLFICSATALNGVRCIAQTEVVENSSPKEVTAIFEEEEMLPFITNRLVPDLYKITMGEEFTGEGYLCISFFANGLYSYNPYWAKTKSGTPSSKVSFAESLLDYEIKGRFQIQKSIVSRYIINGEICLEKP